MRKPSLLIILLLMSVIGATIEVPIVRQERNLQGYWLLFTSRRDNGTHLYRMRPDGTEMQALTKPDDGFDLVSFEAWSPDGEWIVFKAREDGTKFYDLYRIHPDGSDLQRLTKEYSVTQFEAWSPDGEWMVFGTIHEAQTELYRMRSDGRNAQIVASIPGDKHFGAWSPDGEWVVFNVVAQEPGSSTGQLYRSSFTDNHIENLTPESDGLFATWSLDGEWLYFTSERENPGSYMHQLYRMHPNGSNVQRLTIAPVYYGFTYWLQDGRWLIVGVTRVAAGPDIYRMSPDGSDQLLLASGPTTWIETVSPNEDWVYYGGSDFGPWRVLIENGESQRMPNWGMFAAWSPDNEWIVTFTDEGIYKTHADGSDIQRLADSNWGEFAAWSPDGEWFYFISNEDNDEAYSQNFFRVRLDGGVPQRLTNHLGMDEFVGWYLSKEIP